GRAAAVAAQPEPGTSAAQGWPAPGVPGSRAPGPAGGLGEQGTCWLLLLVQVVLGDRAFLALFRHDYPGNQVHQRGGTGAEDGEYREDDADDVGVDAEELPDPRADPGDHASFSRPDQLLLIVHTPIMPLRRAPRQPPAPAPRPQLTP